MWQGKFKLFLLIVLVDVLILANFIVNFLEVCISSVIC